MQRPRTKPTHTWPTQWSVVSVRCVRGYCGVLVLLCLCLYVSYVGLYFKAQYEIRERAR